MDGTDKEINATEDGATAPDEKFLVIGHECLGRVLEVGRRVSEQTPGDYVVPTVRRPGDSVYDQIDQYDMTTENRHVAVLLEPASIIEKALFRPTRRSGGSRSGARKKESVMKCDNTNAMKRRQFVKGALGTASPVALGGFDSLTQRNWFPGSGIRLRCSPNWFSERSRRPPR